MELASSRMQPKFKNMMRRLARKIRSGEITLKTALKAAAEMGEAEVRKAISDGDWTPNNPHYAAHVKESETPLIDSGDMRKYVTSAVRKPR